MQTKINDDPLKKMSKSQKIGLIGGLAGTAAQFIPGVGPIVSAAINAGTQGLQQKAAGDEAKAAADAQNEVAQANQVQVDNSAQMNNASTNLGAKPVYDPNDPYGTGLDSSMLKKTGKTLKPIESYYGEAKNLSSLTYKNSILMKTISGVSTLEKDGVVSPAEEKIGKKIFGEDYDPSKADRF